MIGTISMLALVAAGYTGMTPAVILGFALLNAKFGGAALPQPDGTSTCNGFARTYLVQLGFTTIGYGLGAVAALVIAAIG